MSKIAIVMYGAVVLLVAAAPWLASEGALRFATECLLILSMAQMWNLLAGYAGLVSFGHQVFVGVGAYAVFLVSDTLDLSPYWVLPIAPLVCAIIASVIARPLFRLARGLFLDRIVGVLGDRRGAGDQGIVARRQRRAAADVEPADRSRLVRAGDVLDRGCAGAGIDRRAVPADAVELRSRPHERARQRPCCDERRRRRPAQPVHRLRPVRSRLRDCRRGLLPRQSLRFARRPPSM